MIDKNDAPRYWDILRKVQVSEDAGGTKWRDIFTEERKRKELELAELYSRDFAHGTTGHNQLMLIAQLAQIIDFIIDNFEFLEKD